MKRIGLPKYLLLLRISFPGRPIFIQLVPEQLHEGALDEVAPPVPLQLGGAHVPHDVLQTENATHLWREIQIVVSVFTSFNTSLDH